VILHNSQRPTSDYQPLPTPNSQLGRSWDLGIGSGWELVIGSWELLNEATVLAS
jgi:hypothetical protein